MLGMQAKVGNVSGACSEGSCEYHGAHGSQGSFQIKLEGPANLWGKAHPVFTPSHVPLQDDMPFTFSLQRLPAKFALCVLRRWSCEDGGKEKEMSS